MNWITQHSGMSLLVTYIVSSTAISALPPPQAGSSPFYEWFYKFANGLATNVTALRGRAAFDPKPDVQSQTVATHTDTVTTAKEPKP